MTLLVLRSAKRGSFCPRYRLSLLMDAQLEFNAQTANCQAGMCFAFFCLQLLLESKAFGISGTSAECGFEGWTSKSAFECHEGLVSSIFKRNNFVGTMLQQLNTASLFTSIFFVEIFPSIHCCEALMNMAGQASSAASSRKTRHP